MIVQVKHQLTNTRNPVEYFYKLETQTGELIQVLGDNYCLIKFEQFLIKDKVTVNGKKVTKIVPLEWYVHEEDFYIKQ